jgi:predicted HTH domain antitoxin
MGGNMKFEVNLPDNSYKDYTEHDIKMIMASALYDKGVVAAGYAAESVGIEKYTFINEMGKYGVPVLNLSVNDAERIVENAKRRAKARR